MSVRREVINLIPTITSAPTQSSVQLWTPKLENVPFAAGRQTTVTYYRLYVLYPLTLRRGASNTALQHIESLHAEGQPYSEMEKAQASTLKEEEEGQYAECPFEGCGEILLLEELDYHLELHDQEVVDMDHAGQSRIVTEPEQRLPESERSNQGASSSRQRSSPGHAAYKEKPSTISDGGNSRQQNAISAWKNILNMPSSARRLADSEKRAAANAVPGRRLGVSQMFSPHGECRY